MIAHTRELPHSSLRFVLRIALLKYWPRMPAPQPEPAFPAFSGFPSFGQYFVDLTPRSFGMQYQNLHPASGGGNLFLDDELPALGCSTDWNGTGSQHHLPGCLHRNPAPG